MKLPKLTTSDGGVSGYESRKIADYMKSIGKEQEWSDFSNGMTGMIVRGKFIVYKWDVESFLRGESKKVFI